MGWLPQGRRRYLREVTAEQFPRGNRTQSGMDLLVISTYVLKVYDNFLRLTISRPFVLVSDFPLFDTETTSVYCPCLY